MRVLGIGDNVADHYLNTNVIYPGGNAFNFAAFARLLGAEADYLGVFGKGNLPCNAENNMHVVHLVIQVWFRGY